MRPGNSDVGGTNLERHPHNIYRFFIFILQLLLTYSYLGEQRNNSMEEKNYAHALIMCQLLKF